MPSPTENAVAAPKPDALSFVVAKAEGYYDYWNVQTTGNWSDDCAVGRTIGEEFLAFIGQHSTNGNSTLLGCIVGSMVDNAIAGRRARGAEVAFLARVSEYAMALAVVVERPEALSAA